MREVFFACGVLTLMTACCPIITPCIYEEAQIGDSIQEVLDCAGPPYCINECEEGGVSEYVYVTRLEIAPDVHRHRHWIFVVDAEGCIVNRYICDDEYYEHFFLGADDEGARPYD